MTDHIPPLLSPGDLPPVHTQADLDRLWRALMGQLGFSRRTLWLMFIGPDGECQGQLTQIDMVPVRPGRRQLDQLLGTCAQIVRHDLPTGSTIAFLRSRPGRGPVDAAEAAGVPCEPVYVANDEQLSIVTDDDLGRRATG